jgi:hypothetical protein
MKMIMNGDYVRIWKEMVAAYVKELSRCSPVEGLSNSVKRRKAVPNSKYVSPEWKPKSYRHITVLCI